MEDPQSIRLNIRHYQELLKLQSTQETRKRIIELLAEAQAQLPAAAVEASERTR